MAYQVLARKWRPQNFEEVVGQEPITRTLQNALIAGRVAHAFLFSGPRGVGKTSVARILAKALNCEAGPTPHPDNTCEICRAITNGSSLDVLEIDGASNRGIDEVRDLREKIKYLPTQGKYRVYIIDEVHMLTKEAFNALLKTLEEPPAHAVFVLATTEPHKVPVTIMSRCQRYDFRRIPTGVIEKHLAKLAEQEGWHIDPEGLALVARAAEGGLRDAQGFLDQVVTFGGEGVNATEIARILGVTDRGALLGTLTAIINRNGPDLLNLIEALYTQGQDLGRFYQDLILYARHLLVAGLHPEARHLAAVADTEWNDLSRLAGQVPAVHLHNLLSVLLQGEEELKRSPHPRLALEVLLLRVIHLEPILPLVEWLERLAALEKRLEAGVPASLTPAAPASKSAPAVQEVSPSEVSPTELPVDASLTDRWQAFLNHVQETGDAPLYGKLAHCRFLGLKDHCLKLGLKRAWNGNGASHEARLTELAKDFFGPETTVEFEVEATKTPKKAAAAPKKSMDMQKLQQQALEIFGGEWLGAPPEKEKPE
jgi:DNA polymerase III subunit gamma/tau